MLLSAALMQIAAQAQNNKLAESRRAKITAIMVYEDYVDRLAKLTLRGDLDEYHFLESFGYKGDYDYTHKGDSVYNDIIPLNQPQRLTALQYSRAVDSVIREARIEYHNLSFDNPIKKGHEWWVTCTYYRTVSFLTLDSVIYPRYRFQYKMTIVMSDTLNIELRPKKERGQKEDNDSIYSNARIVDISVTEPLDKFVVIINPDALPLMWRNESIENYDPECNCWMTKLSSQNILNDVKINSATGFFTRLSHKNPHPNFYSFSYHRLNMFGIGLSASPISFGNQSDKRFSRDVENGSFGDIQEENISYKFSLFYGKQLGGNSLTSFFNIGADLVYSRYIYNGTFSTAYEAEDSDGDIYIRRIFATLNKEQRNLYELTVPLTFSSLKTIFEKDNNYVFFSFEMGVFGSIRILSNGKFDMDAKYRGFYPQYFNVEFEKYYDYGDYHITESAVEKTIDGEMQRVELVNGVNYNQGKLQRFDFGVEGGLGIWCNFKTGSLFKFDVKLRKGIMPVVNYTEYDNLTTKYDHYESMLQTSNDGQLNLYLGISFVKLLKNNK